MYADLIFLYDILEFLIKILQVMSMFGIVSCIYLYIFEKIKGHADSLEVRIEMEEENE